MPTYKDLINALVYRHMAVLSHKAIRVYLAYLAHHGQQGAFPSISRLERLCGLGRPSIVEAKRELAEAGLIEIFPRGKGRADLILLPESSSESEPVVSGSETEPVQKSAASGSVFRRRLVRKPNPNDSMNEIKNEREKDNFSTGSESEPPCPHTRTERLAWGDYLCRKCKVVLSPRQVGRGRGIKRVGE